MSKKKADSKPKKPPVLAELNPVPLHVVRRFNGFPWYSATEVTPRAESLVRQHVSRMQAVFAHLARTTGASAIDACSSAQSAGHAANGYDELWDLLDEVDYRKAPSKMPIVLALASYYFWDQDPDLHTCQNPWEAIVALFELGNCIEFDQNDVVLEYKGGRTSYPLVGTG